MIAVWVFMVAMTGYALFHITFQVEALEGQLTELNRQIEAEKEHIHNLRAEWSYSTRPDWIEAMGREYLPELEPMHPAQVVRIEEIPFRRPDAPEDSPQASFGGETEGTPAAEAANPAAAPGPAEAEPATLVRTSQ
jgi:hypothetical protein